MGSVSDIGRYRRIRPRWWLEPAVVALSEGERIVALYCLSGPPTNSLGLYRLSPAGAAEDLGIDTDVFRRRFDVVCRAFCWRFDAAARVIWIPGWLEENTPQSLNVVKSWRAAFNEIPDCGVKAEAAPAIVTFLQSKSEAFCEAFGEVIPQANPEAKAVGIPEAFRDSSAIQDQDQDQDQEPFQEQEQLQLQAAQSAPRLVGDDRFETFWTVYPKKLAKGAARRAWQKLRPDARLTAEIIAAVEQQKTWPHWLKDAGQFIPHPATWLNAGRWQDEMADPISAPSSPISPQGQLNVLAMRRAAEYIRGHV